MGELELGSLAEKANAEHRACESAAATAVEHAMNAGEHLARVKASLAHGEFLPWLSANFEGSRRTASTYIRLADNREALNEKRASHSIRGALKELSAPGDAIHGEVYAEKWRPCEGGHEKIKTYYTIEEYASDHGYRISPPLLIDTEYREVLPPHRPHEYAGLEASILREGCRNAIAACDNTILDGHARYEICTKHGIKFLVRDVEASNRHECLMYIIDAQMGRKNLAGPEASYTRGKAEIQRITSERGISEEQAWEEWLGEAAPA